MKTTNSVQKQAVYGFVNHKPHPLATNSRVEDIEWIVADHAIMPVGQHQKSFVRTLLVVSSNIEGNQRVVFVQPLSRCRNAVTEGLLTSLCVYDSGQCLTLIVELALFLSKIKLAHLDV